MTQAKTLFWNLLNVILILVIAYSAFCAWHISRYFASLPITRTIVVSADGKAKVTPDLAEVSFSVVSEAKTAEEAQADNNTKMTASIDYIKSQGVEAKDIQTSGYNLSPRYEYDTKKKATFISGYTLMQTVSVKLRDFEKAKVVVGYLPTLGINQINGVNFSVENPDTFQGLARQEAFAKARAKAEVMAKQNGVWLGRVVTFSENQGGSYPRFYGAEAMMSKDGGAPTPAPIEPGTQEVTSSVSVTYELR